MFVKKVRFSKDLWFNRTQFYFSIPKAYKIVPLNLTDSHELKNSGKADMILKRTASIKNTSIILIDLSINTMLLESINKSKPASTR